MVTDMHLACEHIILIYPKIGRVCVCVRARLLPACRGAFCEMINYMYIPPGCNIPGTRSDSEDSFLLFRAGYIAATTVQGLLS